MEKKTFFLFSGIIFVVAGVSHLLRALSSWDLSVEGFAIPVGFSYLAGIALLLLSYQSFKLYQKK
ncbi:MAG: hypothetical protein AABW82_01575 [Nanoarchaeota archaeon]